MVRGLAAFALVLVATAAVLLPGPVAGAAPFDGAAARERLAQAAWAWSHDPQAKALWAELLAEPGVTAVVPEGPREARVYIDGPHHVAGPPGWTLHEVQGRPVRLMVPATGSLHLVDLPPPDGPALPPADTAGIGPGAALQVRAGPTGGVYACSASHLFEDQDGTYYLATAGHCVVRNPDDPTPYQGRLNPDQVMDQIAICVEDCLNNHLSLGGYVLLVPEAGYHPVAFGQSAGPGQDFGLIEVPKHLQGLVRPWMPQWGGPNAVGAAATGDLLAYVGHGHLCCPTLGLASHTPYDQARLGLAVLSTPEEIIGIADVTGGDSGSGVETAHTEADRVVQGDLAVGVITHAIEGESAPFYGTAMAHGIALATNATGLQFSVVRGDATTRPPPPPRDIPLALTVADVRDVVRPGQTKVEVQGTLAYGFANTTAGNATRAFYLHSNECDESMDEDPHPDNRTCYRLGVTVGSVTFNIGSWSYPLRPPSSDLLAFDQTRPAVVHLRIDPVALVDAQASLRAEIVARGLKVAEGTGTAAMGAPVSDLDIALDWVQPLVGIEAGQDLRLVLEWQDGYDGLDLSDGHVNRLDLPLRDPPQVQVSLDDPGFTPAARLIVNGTSAWTAEGDVAGVPEGPHVAYVRLVTLGVPGGALPLPFNVTGSPIVVQQNGGLTPTHPVTSGHATSSTARPAPTSSSPGSIPQIRLSPALPAWSVALLATGFAAMARRRRFPPAP